MILKQSNGDAAEGANLLRQAFKELDETPKKRFLWMSSRISGISC